ncbi:MAG: Fibro-slime domain protein [Candidatus Peribacteria bacterium]|nr:Fibro-slime domain protein [Candidatus Peribacteria bacterium]
MYIMTHTPPSRFTVLSLAFIFCFSVRLGLELAIGSNQVTTATLVSHAALLRARRLGLPLPTSTKGASGAIKSSSGSIKKPAVRKLPFKVLSKEDAKSQVGAGSDATHPAAPISLPVLEKSIKCGDGLVIDPETCDDHNAQDGDGCSATCKVEAGYSCGTSQPSFCASTCGDGIRTTNEQCDDGNTAESDGCTACIMDGGYSCTRPLGGISSCTTPPVCGNGKLETGEACDDNNARNNDGCSSACKIEVPASSSSSSS